MLHIFREGIEMNNFLPLKINIAINTPFQVLEAASPPMVVIHGIGPPSHTDGWCSLYFPLWEGREGGRGFYYPVPIQRKLLVFFPPAPAQRAALQIV